MGSDRFLSTGRQVIARESEALAKLAETLDGGFTDAVDLILNAPGRVIVSGMGKSGHIARKIAATLASTGTPSHFVHPAEASHGDLGMLTKGDVALVLSNSGETPELSDIIAYTRRFAIPMIGVAGRRESSLIRQSDVALILPDAGEACPMGLAPTTSTTMTLALGDALAVALMEHRRFTPENFRDYHPGGKLGARLTLVRDVMHPGDEMPLVDSGTGMGEALVAMSQKGFGVVGVRDADGRLTGIVTDGDLRRHMSGLLELGVDDVMTRTPRTIGPDALAEEALGLMTMNSPKFTCLFVVDPNGDGAPLGVVNIHDLLRAGVA